MMCEPAWVRSTATALCTVANCSGHNDRSVERRGDNPAGVIQLTANQARIPAKTAGAGIWFGQQTSRQLLPRHSGLRAHCFRQ